MTTRARSPRADRPASLLEEQRATPVSQRIWIMVLAAVVALAAGCGAGTSAERVNDEPTGVEDTAATAEPGAEVSAESTVRPAAEPTAEPATAEPTVESTTSIPTAETYTSIRDVDFLNGFTYEASLGFDVDDRGTSATVSEGVYQQGEVGDIDYFWFGVKPPEFGDLDGDGSEEAIVATTWNGGGSGYFDSVRAFRLVEGTVEDAGQVHFGDRGDGGIQDVQIDSGFVNVWAFSTTQGACCPNEVTKHRLVLGEHFLVSADRGVTRTWLSSNFDGDELTFVPGTSSAVVVIYGSDLDAGFTFEAGAGQRLTLSLSNGPAPADISVTAQETGEVTADGPDMVLPVDGYYDVSISFDEERTEKTTFEVVIDGQPEPLVSWVPSTDQTVISNDPFVRSSLVWPVFVSTQPGTAAANTALGAHVSQLDDDWLVDVTDLSEPQGDSSYEVSYDVTLVTDDLVSIRFDFYDYVCCRPYPNYGTRAAVLDLAAGRILAVDEMLDMSRIDEVIDIWIGELEMQGLLPEGVADLLGARPDFDALTLVPGGVEFATDRNSLGGGTPGTSTFVSFDQLGDLIDPLLVARVTAG